MSSASTFRIAFIVALGATSAQLASVAAQAPRVYHVPTAESLTGERIEIVADVARGWEANLEVRFRTLGAEDWNRSPFERNTETSYRAEIPGKDVVSPGLEYYIASFTEAAETIHFASASTPHPVIVRDAESTVLIEQELDRFEKRRASFHAAAEYVDFGRRTTEAGQDVKDRYYRLDVDFTYRLFRFPLRAFRLGFTQMLGDTPITERGVDDCPNPCEQSAGFRAGGFAELRWRLASFVDVDTRVLIQATPDGFGFGGRGELRFGDETATYFSLGGEGIAEVGTNFFVRLGWSTVPRFPMAASIELTDYPSSHREHGVRLVYDIAYDFGLGLRVGGRVGYQARDQNIGGVSGGVGATLDF